MIKSVVRTYYWPPNVIGGLYIDGEDYLSLEFWYNDAVEISKEIKTPKKEKE